MNTVAVSREWFGLAPSLASWRLALADAKVLSWPRPELRRPFLPLSRGAEDEPVALQGVDGQEGLPRVRAEGVCPVHGPGLPGRVELEGALDRGTPVGQRDHERVA